MGTGDVPGVPAQQCPARRQCRMGHRYHARRAVRRASDPPRAAREIPYPPAGFVPYPIVWPRWSFSYPGADFSAATVTMTRDGQRCPVRSRTASAKHRRADARVGLRQSDSNSTTPHTKPAGDTTYTVNVNNVRIGSALPKFLLQRHRVRSGRRRRRFHARRPSRAPRPGRGRREHLQREQAVFRHQLRLAHGPADADHPTIHGRIRFGRV